MCQFILMQNFKTVIKHHLLIVLWLPELLYGQQLDYQLVVGPSSSTRVTQGQVNNRGGVSLNIPLALQTAGFTNVAVGLSYYSSGTKVDEISSIVGHNWSLMAGGVITREIRDVKDNTNTPIPRLTSSDLSLISQYAEDEDLDTEPDLFTFQFGNVSGSFVIADGKVVIMPYQELDIFIYTGFSGIEIITTSGIKYYFGTSLDSRERTRSVDHVTQAEGEEQISAWYLTKIEDQISGRYITFRYTNNSPITESTGRAETKYRRIKPENGCQNIADKEDVIKHKSYTPQLKSIETDSYGELNFIYDGKFLTEVISKDSNDIVKYVSVLSYQPYGDRKFLVGVDRQDPYGESGGVYAFGYINPQELPNRLSYSQDHWGYYNGKTDNNTLLPSYDAASAFDGSSPMKLTGYFSAHGADRSPDSNFAQIGMLERVTYPGGAVALYDYEANQVVESVTSYQGTSIKTEILKDDGYSGGKTITIPSQFDQTISIDLSLTNTDPSPSGKLTVVDEASGVKIINGYTYAGTGYKTFDAEKGKFYTVTIENRLPYADGMASAYISHRVVSDPVTADQTITVGGVRVSKVTYLDPMSVQSTESFYYYGHKKTPNLSSGVRNHKINFASYVTKFIKADNSGTCEYFALNANSNLSSRTSGNQDVRYKYITRSDAGSDFENGGVQYEYIIENNTEPVSVLGVPIEYAPWSNDAILDGLLKTEEVFKKDGTSYTLLKKTTNNYEVETDLSKAQVVLSQIVRNRYETPDEYTGVNKYDVSSYEYHSQFSYLSSKENWVYDENGSNPIYSLTTYKYDSPHHTFLTESSATNSEGEVLTTKYKYPEDYTVPSQVITNMIDDHFIAVPIEVITQKDNEIISASAKEYEYDNDYNYLALKKTYQKENLNIGFNYSNDGQTFTEPYEWQNEILKRDDQGHVLSETNRSGLTTTYIRGYGGKYVTAVISNATHAQVMSALSLDINLRVDQSLSPTQISDLKIQLPEARITSYTFLEDVGVATIKDHNGKTQSYTYDTFGRVKHVKDHQGHLLSTKSYYIK